MKAKTLNSDMNPKGSISKGFHATLKQPIVRTRLEAGQHNGRLMTVPRSEALLLCSPGYPYGIIIFNALIENTLGGKMFSYVTVFAWQLMCRC